MHVGRMVARIAVLGVVLLALTALTAHRAEGRTASDQPADPTGRPACTTAGPSATGTAGCPAAVPAADGSLPR